MIPIDKAIELFEKMNDNNLSESLAKKCALIAVDEIIRELNDEIWFSYCEDNNIDKRENFWQEVKKEI
jgi:hypothetical protein